MNWQEANREVFEDSLAEGNISSAQAAIEDAKSRGIDTSEMESALKAFISEDKENI